MSKYGHLTPDDVPLVRIDWEDITFADNWEEGDEDGSLQPRECLTAGYLLEEATTYLIVASSYAWRERQWGTLHAVSKSPPTITVIQKAKTKARAK